MSKIISIGTAVPRYQHNQQGIREFMQRIYAFNEADRRKLKFLYAQSAIETRYSAIADYSLSLPEWTFYPASENLEPFPSLEKRMEHFERYAAPLSVTAIRNCLDNLSGKEPITHLITASCTGMSAPGLDLEIMDLMGLPDNINRTSVNFMGCYAAIHALKMADAICNSSPASRVMIVCTELCTLHFQREATPDNITSSLLFGDGSAAALVTGRDDPSKGLHLNSFYSEVIRKGKKDMSWGLSSTGFQMTLSAYIPQLIEADFESLVGRSLKAAAVEKEEINHWCIHPGGKKILEAIQTSLHLAQSALSESYEVLKQYGNMSSPTLLFVLDRIMKTLAAEESEKSDSHGGGSKQTIFGAAFGPGLTMETFIASYAG